MDNRDNHGYWMKYAIAEAEKALELNEIPVGAVIVKDEKIIGRGSNRVVNFCDPTAHAEIIAIGAAAEVTGYERLLGCTMYVTLEPCPMCAGAIVLARIPCLVIGANDPQMGSCGSIYDICCDKRLNHLVEVTFGVLEQECSYMLHTFFQSLRDEKKTITNRS